MLKRPARVRMGRRARGANATDSEEETRAECSGDAEGADTGD